jgi:predicted adenine nucleotide alpha hydrolase (AANH) superfamily ATPase
MKMVFVSYSSPDRDKVRELVNVLRKEKDIEVWFDEDEIYPGDDFLQAMKQGIKKCDKFLICLSLSFHAKPPKSWVRNELRMAILREMDKGRNIVIPIRLERGGDVPEELGTRAYADLSTPERWNYNFPRLVEAIKR